MLNGKVVLVTGGAGLLGKEFVRAILENNGTAILGDINLSAANDFIQVLKREYPKANCEAQLLDITSKTSIQSVLKSIHERHGKLDALVNNAYPRNKNYGRHFFDVEYEDFCENMSLNLGGYFLTSQQTAKLFKEQGFGNIINISSIYGVIPPRFEVYENTQMTTPVEYAAIKSSLIHLTKYMAKYFRGMNIRVNSLSPGGILNNQPASFLNAYKSFTSGKGMLDKADLKGTLIYLLSDMSRYVNGQNIIVDDAFSL